uniref:Uncharacterized protein n=1 Tax=Timema douglasi TaxID=61478 RepID=A0A7R8ZFF1_TIMDO|nr:unnamed protein product [Timema douglasi]
MKLQFQVIKKLLPDVSDERLIYEHEEVKSKANLSQENNPDYGTALNILSPGQVRSTVHLVGKPPLEDYNPHLERHVDHPTK